jgi:predicted GNAT family acetyltransferase
MNKMSRMIEEIMSADVPVERRSGTNLSEAYAKGSWMTYERQAEVEFLKAAIPGIKKIAGNKGDIKMDTSGSIVMLAYDGEDASDFSLEFSAYMRVNERTIDIGATVVSAQVKGQRLPGKTIPKGDATPQDVVNMFADVFGSH